MKINLFEAREIQYFELGIFSFNSYVRYLTRGFIASTGVFNLLTCAFNLPVCAFNLTTRAFNLATRAFGFELVTCEFELITRGFELVTREFELVTRGFELATRGFELVTRVLFFHDFMLPLKLAIIFDRLEWAIIFYHLNIHTKILMLPFWRQILIYCQYGDRTEFYRLVGTKF